MDALSKIQTGIFNNITSGLLSFFSTTVRATVLEYVEDYYESVLSNKPHDNRCKVTPEAFKELFMTKLGKLDYAKVHGSQVVLDIPDMESFDFSGGLEGLQTILEGTVGKYVEITAKEFSYIYGEDHPNVQNFEDLNNMVFLVEHTDLIKAKEKHVLKYDLPEYMFSDTPPFNLFESLDSFVEDNMDTWIDTAVDAAVDRGL